MGSLDRDELIYFMRRVIPPLSEPLATKVAEVWADTFLDQFKGEKVGE